VWDLFLMGSCWKQTLVPGRMPSLCPDSVPPLPPSTPCLWPPLPLPDPLLHGLPLSARKSQTFRCAAKSSLWRETVQSSRVSHVLAHASEKQHVGAHTLSILFFRALRLSYQTVCFDWAAQTKAWLQPVQVSMCEECGVM